MTAIDKKIERLVTELKQAKTERTILERKRKITCHHCGVTSRLGLFTWVQNYYYKSSYDNWWPSENDICHIRCPKCLAKNYIFTHTQKAAILRAKSFGAFYLSIDFYKDV